MGVADEELEAIKTAMESPLLETTVAGATDVIVNFAGAVGMLEAQQAVEYLKDEAGAGGQRDLRYGQCRFWRSDQRYDHRHRHQECGWQKRCADWLYTTDYALQSSGPAFSGQPIHNGRVETEDIPMTAAYAPDNQTATVEEKDSKIVIPEFLLKSRRR